ncbi:MAG TPA: hypothetical protein VMU76_01800 [Acidimicrobiales bacterium]|nr:hypothetical protein [Acidimicrobiales bacterium]
MTRSHGSSAANGAPRRIESAGQGELDRLREIATEVIGAHATEPMGLYVFRPEEEAAALPQFVAGTVFDETFGANPELLNQEFSRYDHASVLVCVLDHKRRLPAGAMRLIVPSESGLKTINEIEPIWGRPYTELFADAGIVYDPPRTWNLATLAVAPDYRLPAFQGLITLALVQASSMIAARCDMLWTVATMYVPVLRMLQWKLHRPLTEFPGVEPRSYPYHNEAAGLPVWGRLYDWYGRLAERDKVLYDIMVRGTGIEPMVRAADWERAADQVREITSLANLRLHLR